jgi:hypothetical protein
VEAAARRRCVEVAEPACRSDDGGVSGGRVACLMQFFPESNTFLGQLGLISPVNLSRRLISYYSLSNE